MIEVLLWLLISTSDGSYNKGQAVVLERFIDKEQCIHVLKHIPNNYRQEATCVQARVAVPK